MREKLTFNRIVLLLFLLLILVAIRSFESELFYDPFIVFFKAEFQGNTLPEFNSFKLYLNLFFRYTLNSILTVTFLFVLFQNKAIIKTTTILLLFFFVVLIGLFYLCLTVFNDYLILFYVRRFLIQPLFLIIFVPAFYYQKLTNSK